MRHARQRHLNPRLSSSPAPPCAALRLDLPVRAAEAKTEGTGKVYAMSQMLLCEAEDIYKGLQSAVQTM